MRVCWKHTRVFSISSRFRITRSASPSARNASRGSRSPRGDVMYRVLPFAPAESHKGVFWISTHWADVLPTVDYFQICLGLREWSGCKQRIILDIVSAILILSTIENKRPPIPSSTCTCFFFAHVNELFSFGSIFLKRKLCVPIHGALVVTSVYYYTPRSVGLSVRIERVSATATARCSSRWQLENTGMKKTVQTSDFSKWKNFQELMWSYVLYVFICWCKEQENHIFQIFVKVCR